MKIILILLGFLFFSCNGYEKNKVVTTDKTEKQMTLKTLSYNDWYRSVFEAVKSQVNIEDYEKENVLLTLKNISEEQFSLLKQTSKNVKDNKNFQEFFVFHFSEGEVVTTGLYYLFSDGKIAKKASLNISEEKVNLKKTMTISQISFKKMNVLPIDSGNQFQDIVILTNKEGISKFGNPNEILAKIFD